MAKIEFKILAAALRIDIFNQRVSSDALICFHRSIQTALKIQAYIESQNYHGATIEQIAIYCDLNKNTTRQYVRWLDTNGIIKVDRPKLGQAIICYPMSKIGLFRPY
jgi:response regulator of citrate/malate metabolism